MTMSTDIAAQTVTLACVIPAATHEEAVAKLRDMLDAIAEQAEQTNNDDVVSLVDECWLPNDCPNSEYHMLWAHEVTAADLIRAQMQRLAPVSMAEQVRKYAEVSKDEPILSMWLDEVYEGAERCAEAVIAASKGA